jgi:hypothetical protein
VKFRNEFIASGLNHDEETDLGLLCLCCVVLLTPKKKFSRLSVIHRGIGCCDAKYSKDYLFFQTTRGVTKFPSTALKIPVVCRRNCSEKVFSGVTILNGEDFSW